MNSRQRGVIARAAVIILTAALSPLRAESTDTRVEIILDAIESALDTAPVPIDEKLKHFDYDRAISRCEQFLEGEQFRELDTALDKMATLGRYTPEGFLAYSHLLEELTPHEKIPSWHEESDSIHSKLCTAGQHKELAWRARGSGGIHTVSPEQAKEFERQLREGKKLCLAVGEDEPRNPTRLNLEATIALGLGMRESKRDELMSLSLSSEHPDPALTTAILHYLTPRWHGSAEEMADFLTSRLPKWPDGQFKFNAMINGLGIADSWNPQSSIFAHPKGQELFNRTLQRYEESWDSHPEMREFLAEQIYSQRQFQYCLEVVDHGLKTHPDHLKFHQIRARALAKLNRYEEVVPLATEILERDSEDEVTWFLYGEALHHLGDPAGAKEKFMKCLELSPQSRQFIDENFPGWEEE